MIPHERRNASTAMQMPAAKATLSSLAADLARFSAADAEAMRAWVLATSR